MILVHHLKIGRSIFTVWLLEELGVDYDVKVYERNEIGRAPENLKEPHPLGKSPVIEDGDLTLSESGAITMYLLENHDPKGRFTPPTERKKRAEWLQWLHYTEASAFAPILITLLLSREQEPKPPLFSMFAHAELSLHLNYIQDFLGDKPFLLGDGLQAPDFGMGFILQMADRLGALQSYPTLKAYLDRLTGHDGFARAMSKTGGE